MASTVADLLCLADVERAAAAVLPADVRDFVAGGSGTETTLDANRAALDRVFLVPRVLRDVSRCSTEATLLGHRYGMPVALAPVAYQRLLHPDGELAAARAAKAAGVPFTASTLSSVPVEQLTAIGGSVWFQLYWLREPGRSLDLVARAADAGAEAVMLTVDVPWMGRRLRDVRNRFALPDRVRAAHLDDRPSAAHRATSGAGSALAVHTGAAFSPALTWSAVAEVRERTSLPLILKGVLAPEDAVRAVECGVDAVVVSNHGGRQLDGAVPSADALPAVVAAVADHCEVLLDSGVRTGTDVLRALALGASGVLIGRPPLWGLALAGEPGVRHVLHLLAEELKDALGLAGCATVPSASRIHTTHAR
ncbi:alpha-hydroxy acid oxidase [Streptomyces kanamyceticus]|uniref:Alpha-hydroxy-acid oxidizing protein n=1 Tax=Streptomyces kanamyceticus TaxID=1967 RepID=A0A5J6G5N4_STRKN|nr:alpha-hydroxy acid oxidase [Streptomyces kanamyceticus]QEU90012.1 alpha-hydroxy-acid oxidizing protein [Streptomyces kanamyceticus]